MRYRLGMLELQHTEEYAYTTSSRVIAWACWSCNASLSHQQTHADSCYRLGMLELQRSCPDCPVHTQPELSLGHVGVATLVIGVGIEPTTKLSLGHVGVATDQRPVRVNARVLVIAWACWSCNRRNGIMLKVI